MTSNIQTKRKKNKFIIPLYLRWYQKEFVQNFKDKKRALLVYHRRAGKDLLCWTYLIKRAFHEKGNYFYIFPEYAQARKALWDSITEDGRSYLDFIPRKMISNIWKHEMKLKLASGSVIQLLGSDNFDSMRGTNPRGVVLSEYAYQNPLVWTLILDPILTKNKGWAIFNSTPNGKNHFYDLYNYALENPHWYVKLLTIEDTELISPKELENKKKLGISEEFIQQEYYCSFDIGVQGSYYGKYVRDMKAEGRIGHVPYDKNLLVYTAWDLGFADSMSIIFFQKRGNEILIIDFYENHGYQLAHYLDHLRSKDYAYGKHFVPFDAKSHDRTGNTFVNIAKDQGFNFTVLKQQRSIIQGIEKVRGVLPRIFMDKDNCDFLIRCLLEYHADFDQKTHVYKNIPKHNWASHAADALRYLVQSLDELGTDGMSVEKLDELKRKAGYQLY